MRRRRSRTAGLARPPPSVDPRDDEGLLFLPALARWQVTLLVGNLRFRRYIRRAMTSCARAPSDRRRRRGGRPGGQAAPARLAARGHVPGRPRRRHRAGRPRRRGSARPLADRDLRRPARPLLFGVSALYHRGHWSPRVEQLLKRLDHSNIFLIIAGTYTPFAVILLARPRRHRAALDRLGRRPSAASPSGSSGSARRAGSTRRSTSRSAGSPCSTCRTSCETGGAAVVTLLGDRRRCSTASAASSTPSSDPNPSPRWFGFHEVFHALTLGAFVVHYIAVSLATYRTAA